MTSIHPFSDQLDYLSTEDKQALEALSGLSGSMIKQAIAWSKINTGSWNAKGLKQFSNVLAEALSGLEAKVTAVDLPPIERIGSDGLVQKFFTAPTVEARARPEAPIQVIFTGHYDTVFPDGTFETIKDLGDGKLGGPGLADMKGGIIVMLEALKAFEATSLKSKLGYHIVLTPDEETGNFASHDRLRLAAETAHVGMTFEPAMETGAMSGARKGSGIFDVIFHGCAAHAGRNPQDGLNAIHAAADFAVKVQNLNGVKDGVTFNVGRIDGGGPNNIVPDLGIVRLGVRATDTQSAEWAVEQLKSTYNGICTDQGVTGHFHGSFYRPPKPKNAAQKALFEATRLTGKALDLSLFFNDTGGVCEGNNVFAAGTPNIDTLGVRGGRIHSHDEFVITESFEERAKLTLLILLRLADGRINAPQIKSLMKAS